MIEVLVAIILLSVGLLGAARMQLAATRTTQQSAYQTAALQLAADIADSVRAYSADEAHAPALEAMFDVDYVSKPGVLPAMSAGCYFSRCETLDFLASEINEWKIRLATSFPEARIKICRDTEPWNEEAKVYKWDCSGGGYGVPLVVKLGWKIKNPDGSSMKDSEGNFPPSLVVPVAA